MLVTSGVCDQIHQGPDAGGDSILSGFGSSSGSSADETCEREEFLDELTRQMAENMLRDDDQDDPNNKHNTTRFQPNNVLQNQGKQREEVKESGDGSTRAGFVSPDGSGMRLVFLGESGSRNGSAGGTGVFIPHATNTLRDHYLRKKPAAGRCSTVLIPERVLNSLKQHHEKRNASQPHLNAMFHASPNQRLQHQETPNNTVVNTNKNDDGDDDELQLPQEWTY